MSATRRPPTDQDARDRRSDPDLAEVDDRADTALHAHHGEELMPS
jgi:hypothetical protein